VLSSKGIKCFALAAALFVAAVSPAAGQETEPLPAPPLPAPDPAPPAPAPTRPRPAPPKPAATAPAPVRTPRYVTPAVDNPVPQTRPALSAPVRAKKPARKKVPAAAKPIEALRHLPIRDASIPATGERAVVLAATGFVPAVEHNDGLGTIALAAVCWFGLAVALLLIAYVAPLQVVPQPLGGFLYERRNQFALVGVNMVAAAVVCYLVVVTS